MPCDVEPSVVAVGGPSPPSPRRFERLLRAALGGPLQIYWTTNRVRLASLTRRPGGAVVRLHEAFAAGSEAEARQLVALLFRREPAASGPLRLWFARAQAAPQGAEASHPAEQGLLAELFAELNAAYFHQRCQAGIRWGRASSPGLRRRRRRSMQLGCYDFARRQIRVHPALAEPWVPRYVVALVVYHEMLHEVFGLDQRGGRRCAHPPEFAVCEQGHPDYARARAWERAHLPRLLAWRA